MTGKVFFRIYSFIILKILEIVQYILNKKLKRNCNALIFIDFFVAFSLFLQSFIIIISIVLSGGTLTANQRPDTESVSFENSFVFQSMIILFFSKIIDYHSSFTVTSYQSLKLNLQFSSCAHNVIIIFKIFCHSPPFHCCY